MTFSRKSSSACSHRLVVLLCVVAGIAPALAAATPQVRSKLVLKTEVLNQTYCSSGNLRLNLRFTFVNTSSETLILYRNGTIVPRYVVGKDRKALAKRKYLSNAHMMMGSLRPSREEIETVGEELFVVLKPGESFLAEKDTYIGVKDGSDSDVKLIPGQSYVLQLRVSTWFNDPALAHEVGERWRNKGTLWYGDLVTEPMDFSIKSFDAADTCD